MNGLIFVLLFSSHLFSENKTKGSFIQRIPRYLVVLDPGHGGLHMKPISVYGDKFDLLSHEYKDKFRSGANYKGVAESEITYLLARIIQKYLFLTQSKNGQQIFGDILKKYTQVTVEEIHPIEVFISRKNTYPNNYFKIKNDINAPYRLYDYLDIKSHKIKKGRISNINSLQPDLVISLHLTNGKKNKMGALNAVITPAYTTFKMAIDYVKNPGQRSQIRKKFKKGPYSNWFLSKGRNHFQSFLLDASIYFTGFWCTKNCLNPIKDKFKGYRHNMVSWRYQDKPNWHLKARKHQKFTPYAKSLKYIRLNGGLLAKRKIKIRILAKRRWP